VLTEDLFGHLLFIVELMFIYCGVKRREEMVREVVVAVVVGLSSVLLVYGVMWLMAFGSRPSVRVRKEIRELLKRREECERRGEVRESNELGFEIRRLEKKLEEVDI